MSKIDTLIEQVCPEGVEFKELGEVAVIGTGSSNGNEAIENGKYPLFVRSKFIKRINTYEFDEEAIIIPGEGGIGEIFHYINGKYALHQRAYRIHLLKGDISTMFVYYYMKSNFKKFILQKAVSSTVGSIRKPMIEKFQIPIPPLPIQQEIVAILDKFTQLEAELEAELEARKTQYEYYRNELLNFEGKEVEWKTLGEVGTFVRGNGLQKKDFTESGVGCIHYGQIYTYYGTFTDKTKSFVSEELSKKLRKAQKGDLIIATTSENIEDVCKTVVWLGEEEICISGETYIFKHNQNPKYLAYFLQTQMFFNFKIQNVTGTKVIRVHGDKLRTFKIPLPPLSEQERIVAILDKFDALVNDISVGLPAEIKARRKQYEYYRGKLLNFKNVNNG
ncbi:MAG: restriction endonuclease subunit S [Bacteroidales bacterium]|nr:restriction endonuclease subunit S [Bacteroidales bacterium]MDD3893055.1 restriction endonuclease subunit S [Bacteroidales bacterium]